MKFTKLLATLTSGWFICASLFGQTAVTSPVGLLNLEITPGNGSQKSFNVVSFPLHPVLEDFDGISTGQFSSITENSVQVANAGWIAGALSDASAPYLLHITSGNAEGLLIPVSTAIPNTATELFLATTFNGEVLDLNSLGIAVGENGDSFEIIPADTLSSLFGTPESTGIDGGTNFSDADTIYIFSSNRWNIYFYHTGRNAWVKSSFGFPNADNLIIHPDFAIIYERLGDSTLTINLTGRVPLNRRNVAVKNSGVTFLGNGWPVETTLGQSKIEQLPGWRTGENTSVADSVILRSASGAWEFFFHNGSEWQKSTFGSPTADSQIISPGSGIVLYKSGVAPGLSQLIQETPYTNNL